MIATTVSKPIATATIEPMGSRTTQPRSHLIKIVLPFSPLDPKFAEKGYVASVARKALAGFAPASGEPDRRAFGDVSVASKGKAGVVGSVVVGVEGTAIWPERPDDAAVEHLQTALLEEGYRVIVRAKRECAEDGCLSGELVEWDRPSIVPSGWYSDLICGRHNYRTCAACKSVFVFTSVNAPGQAPSVPCEVCGAVLVEWGGSKLWDVELITRGEAVG
jgi:hypothetical protein